MKHALTLSLLLIAAIGLSAFAPGSGPGKNNEPRTFRADLRGGNEVPPVVTDTSGKLRIQFAKDFSSATLRLDLKDGERVTQAHFHCGAEGVNGPVILFVFGFHNLGWDVDGHFLDNVTITDANIVNTACGATLAEIAKSMADGNVYANVHSVAFPGGVVRGQMTEH